VLISFKSLDVCKLTENYFAIPEVKVLNEIVLWICPGVSWSQGLKQGTSNHQLYIIHHYYHYWLIFQCIQIKLITHSVARVTTASRGDQLYHVVGGGEHFSIMDPVHNQIGLTTACAIFDTSCTMLLGVESTFPSGTLYTTK
jgi:hypothetical protein